MQVGDGKFENGVNFMFQGKFLEDERRLADVGIVDGSVVLASEKSKK
jgi:hypothetical protein